MEKAVGFPLLRFKGQIRQTFARVFFCLCGFHMWFQFQVKTFNWKFEEKIQIKNAVFYPQFRFCSKDLEAVGAQINSALVGLSNLRHWKAIFQSIGQKLKNLGKADRIRREHSSSEEICLVADLPWI